MKIKNCKLSRFAGSRMAGKILLFCLVFLVFGFVGRKADASVILKAPNNLGLVGYWSFNEGVGGLAGDSSGNRNTGTLTGANGLPAWTNGKLGKALKFDGTDDVVTVGTSAFTTGATTITMWVKPTASQQNGLGDLRVGGSGLIIYERTIGAIAERAMMGFRGQPEMNTPTSVITVGAWTFLAFVYNGGAKNDLASFAIYANGVNQTSLTAQGTIGGSTTYNRVGSDQSSAFFNGSIDEVRIYNRALTANEISQLYQSGAAKLNVSPTKYLTSGLVGYWTMDGQDLTTGAIIDKSGNGNTGSLRNMATSTSRVIGKLGQALKFDGVDDYISKGSSLGVYSYTFTTGAWVKQNILGDFTIIRVDNRGPEKGWDIRTTSAGEFKFYVSSGNVYTTIGANIQSGQWYYVAAKYTLSELKLYVNGVNLLTVDPYDITYTVSTPLINIGSDYDSGYNPPQSHNFFNGSIDDVRIYNRALTANEISQLYQSGAVKLNVSPTKYLTSGLVGYWTMDGNNVNWATGKVTDSSGQGNSGYVTNMATSTGVAIGKIGQALKFDGSDDYVEVPDNASLKPTSISVETWVRPAAGLGSQAAQVKKTSDSNGFSLEGSLISFWVNVNGTWRSSGAALPSAMVANQWYHCVGTYDGVNIKVYVNGELKNTGNYPGSITWATSLLNIGRDPIRPTEAARMWNGLIDDVRIYNRALSTGEVLNLYNAGK